MKKSILGIIIAAAAIQTASANYTVIIGVKDKDINFINNVEKPAESKWISIEDNITDWVYGNTECNKWLPLPDDIESGVEYIQNGTDCVTNKERTIEKREQNTVNGEIRIISTETESSIDTEKLATREAIGTSTAQIFNITVGLHPNYSACSIKLKGYGRNSGCNTVIGNYGNIDDNTIRINGIEETFAQIYTYKTGTSTTCTQALQVVNSGGRYDSLPSTLEMVWNGKPYVGTKNKDAYPSFSGFKFTAPCSEFFDVLPAGSTLQIKVNGH